MATISRSSFSNYSPGLSLIAGMAGTQLQMGSASEIRQQQLAAQGTSTVATSSLLDGVRLLSGSDSSVADSCTRCKHVDYKNSKELCFFHALKKEIFSWTGDVLENNYC